MASAGLIRATVAGLFGMIVCAGGLSRADPSFTFTEEEIDLGALLDDVPGSISAESDIEALTAIPVIGADAVALAALRDSLGITSASGDAAALPPLQELVLDQIGTSTPLQGMGYGLAIRSGIRYRPGEGASGSRYYSRMRLSIGDRLSGAFIGERDPGEPRALDLASGSVMYTADGVRLTAGDYRPGFGQGLVFSRYGRSYVSGIDAMQRDPVAIGNTSFEESAYLRGVHAEIRRRGWFAQGWLSSRRRDATLDGDGHAVTIRETGYHLSGGNRDNLRERIGGARFGITPLPGVQLAVAGVVSEYAPGLARGDTEADLYDPAGGRFGHLSASGSIERGMMRLYAEAATLEFDHDAVIAGIDVDGGPVRAAVMARRYDAGYWAPRAGAFSSFGGTGNEEGVYAALEAGLPGGFTGMAVLDIAQTITRTFTSTMPATRRRLQFVAGKRLTGGMTARLAVRSTKTGGDSYDDRAGGALQLEHRPSRGIGWRTVAAYSAGSGDSGLYTEGAVLFRGGLFTGEIGGGLFDIPGYAARYYRYERDVPGYGMSRPVWGRGGTILLLVRRGVFAARFVWRDSDLMARSHEVTVQYDASF